MSEEIINQETEIVESPKTKPSREEKRLEKLRKKLLNPNDIKYQGPLSYRYLRIIAWIALIVGQVVILNTLSTKFFSSPFLSDDWKTVLTIIPELATPLFIIASFGRILDGKRSFKNTILFYGAAFLGVGLGFCFFYARYVEGLFNKVGIAPTTTEIVAGFLGDKADINVFADLFSFVLFHFFINYTPKRFFADKKIYIFRVMCVFPVAFIIASYVLKLVINFGSSQLPFYIYPFLATKSPMVFLIFVAISIWIKNREKLFIKLGATRDEYHKFLLTNRNSLSFSIQLSVLILFFATIDFIITFIIFLIIYIQTGNIDLYSEYARIYGTGQCLALIIAIPFILLYSYTRTHKNSLIDAFIPVIGIALCALVYIEGIYQSVIQLLGL